MFELLLVLFVIVFTFVYGSMAGYLVHWLLHTKLFERLAKAHNTHHELYTVDDFDSETYRDAEKNDSAFVFVPIITTAIVLLCIPLWWIFQIWWIYPLIIGEGVLVGWLNDYLHECFHIRDHRYNKYAWFRKLKKLHVVHHALPKKNHGIIWFLPDKLFRTLAIHE